MVYQYAVNISAGFDSEELDSFYNTLSEGRKQKVNKFLFDKDKVRCTVAEIILLYALWKHYKLKDSDVVFCTNEYGKPYLKGIEHIHLNISHSGDWVLCALGDVPLGVDVEIVSQSSLDLAKHFFTVEEYQDIMLQPIQKRCKAFTKLWTLKESYIKACGKGFSISLNIFRFKFTNKEIQLFCNEKRDFSYTFFSNRLDEYHYRALCVKSDACSEKYDMITVVKMSQLLEFIRQVYM